MKKDTNTGVTEFRLRPFKVMTFIKGNEDQLVSSSLSNIN